MNSRTRLTIRRDDTTRIPPVDAPLAGRSQWIDTLADACARWPLIVLDGEPGVGKSALLESGLGPRLAGRGTLLPIYIRAFPATDWIAGPTGATASAVLKALERHLSDQVFQQVIRESAGPDDLRHLLLAVRQHLDMTPCLMFDELDEYVLGHADHLTTSPDGLKPVALKPSELVGLNPFWATIANLLRSNRLTCVLTTRTAHPSGFSAFNLVADSDDAAHFTLERLGAAEADEVLTAMGGDRDTADWLELKAAIIDDLNPDRTRASVLPIQLVTVMRGLIALGITRAREYRKLGLQGVQQGYLERRIRSAAHSADLGDRPWIIYEMLGHMVSDGRCVPLSEETLAARCPEALRGQLHLALEDLAIWQVTKATETGWRLHHDYLCEPIVAAVRAAHRLERALGSSQRAWAHARGPVQRWRALVPPRLQLRLMRAHLRGRLRYGPAALVVASSTRLLMNRAIVAGLVVALAGAAIATRYLEAETAALVDVFDTEAGLRPAEAEALERLTDAFWPVQTRVLASFAEPRNRPAFERHQREFAVSLGDLAPSRRNGLQREVDRICSPVAAADVQRLRACGLLWIALAVPPPRDQTVALLLDVNFARTRELVSLVPAEARLPTFELALSRFERGADRSTSGLCQLLSAIGLPNDRFAVKRLLHIGDRDVVEHLRQKDLLILVSSACLPQRLGLGDLTDAAEALASEVGTATTPSAAQERVRELASLPSHAGHDAYIERAAEQLLNKASAAADVDQRFGYLRALVHLSGSLTGSMSDRVATLVLSTIAAASRPEDLAPAGAIVNALEMPSPRLVKAIVQALMAKAAAQRDALTAVSFASIADRFSRLLGPRARCDIVRGTFSRFGPDNSPDTVQAIARVAQKFGADCLSPAERVTVQRSILRNLLQLADPGRNRSLLLSELRFWSSFLEPADTRLVAADLLRALQHGSTERRNVIDAMLALAAIAYADLASVAGELMNTPDASDTFGRFVTTFRDDFPPDARRTLETGLVEQLLQATRRDSTALAVLASQSPDDSYFVWNEVFPNWLRRPSSSLPESWGDLLAGLARWLSEENADRALRELLQVGRRNAPRECAVAASLIRPLTAALVRDTVLSWTTCDQSEQREIRTQLSLQGVLTNR